MKKILLGLLFVASTVSAADLTKPSSDDPRVRTVTYKANEVYVIKVQRGTVTRVVLGASEKIDIATPGLSARCDDKVDDEWCISAAKSGNQIIIRPRDRATRNNLEVRTDQHDYSFVFEVLPDPTPDDEKAKKGGPVTQPFYRVVFEYPTTPSQFHAMAVANLLSSLEPKNTTANVIPAVVEMTPEAQLKLQPPQVKNAKYTMQVMPKGEDAAPTMVFDDGRFTYFEFLGARQIPAVFAFNGGGEATRLNTHMEKSFVVVERTARQFTLRLGGAVTGVFNEAFDPTGIDTPTSTVSNNVIREVIESTP